MKKIDKLNELLFLIEMCESTIDKRPEMANIISPTIDKLTNNFLNISKKIKK